MKKKELQNKINELSKENDNLKLLFETLLQDNENLFNIVKRCMPEESYKDLQQTMNGYFQ